MAALPVPVVVPPVELTDDTLGAFEGRLEAVLAAGGPGVVLDMAAVRFLGSSGLGHLVKVGMALEAAQRRLALARCPKDMIKLIRLTGLEALLPHFKTVGDAEAFVASAAVRTT